MMTIGNFSSKWQSHREPDCRLHQRNHGGCFARPASAILPPEAPAVVAPALAVALLSLGQSRYRSRPGYFRRGVGIEVLGQSPCRGETYGGADASVRAEILHCTGSICKRPSTRRRALFVWIERRYRFLNRDFAPGERIGRYTVSYLTRIDHE